MVLVDTSVWIEVFRRPSRLALDVWVDFDDVVTCLPVVQEVLQGFRDEAAFVAARQAMTALPIVDSPIPQEVFLHAAGLFRAGRRAGSRGAIAVWRLSRSRHSRGRSEEPRGHA